MLIKKRSLKKLSVKEKNIIYEALNAYYDEVFDWESRGRKTKKLAKINAIRSKLMHLWYNDLTFKHL